MKRVSSRWKLDNIKVVRRVIVSVIGATVLLIGIALLVLPGPALVVISIRPRDSRNGLRVGASGAQKSSTNSEGRRLGSGALGNQVLFH